MTVAALKSSTSSSMSAFKADGPRASGRRMRECMARVPYATLIATIMCTVGVSVFCVTMYRGVTLTIRLAMDVFQLSVPWDSEARMKPIRITFVTIGAAMGVLGLLLLVLGCLATGATRTSVYRAHSARTGGRITTAFFMVLVYILQLVWLLVMCCLVIVTVIFSLFWQLCESEEVKQNQCIDFTQFYFIFPKNTNQEDMKVCGDAEMKLFCKDYVESAEVMFILATAACAFVLLSLVHYLMCLSANYAHIKDNEKFRDLEEIQRLHESELSTLPKDRF